MESNPNGDKEPTEPTEEDEKKIEQIRKEIEKMKFGGAHRKKGEIKDNYKFWGEQPVPQFNKDIGVKFGPIKKDNKVEEERKEPYMLPPGFFWKDIDVTDASDLDRLYEFLKNNYVEDDDGMFRFDYSRDFLRWHLTAPGYYKNWLVSIVREEEKGGKKKKRMVGFISGIPVEVSIHGTKSKMAEINFLCVNQSFRSHGIAPLLIKEVTRRIHCEDIWQAVYTSGTLLPKPFSTCTYYHRNLNVQKLLDIRFTYLGPNLNASRAKGLYKLPKETSIPGLRPMEEKDVDAVQKLLEDYLNQFKVHGYYSKEEVKHWLVPKKEVVYSYVVENNDHQITDLISFYSLPSSVLQHEKHKKLFACYAFFNVARSVPFKELMRNALILAKQNNFDVYNCLNIMENATIFKDLLFGMGDGSLKYYFYNFVSPDTIPSDLALVLM
ncbi:MAG: GNAT family N-acetyltransferase [archaeon]|nr:GNAT family N-acetyltransferase [archaeon]